MLDDSAFYQAETQMLTRENQMLRQRIRELGISSKHLLGKGSYMCLERQLGELNPTATNSPPVTSSLTAPPLGAETGNPEAAPRRRISEGEDKEE